LRSDMISVPRGGTIPTTACRSAPPRWPPC
jgi:hypothetical protein